MGKVKKKPAPEIPTDPWERWKAIQLTPEEKAQARAEAQRELDRARATGVYERIPALRGKVKFSLSYEEMAGKDDRD